MDILAREIASLKRKDAPTADDAASPSSASASASGGPKKYLKKGDLQRIKEQEASEKARLAEQAKEKERKEKEERFRRDPRSKSLLAFPPKPRTPDAGSPAPAPIDGADPAASSSAAPTTDDLSSSSKPEAFNISPAECVRRLRIKGQPVRLFGESDKDRRLRLRALELMEERGGSAGGLNDFKKALEDLELARDEKEEVRKAKQGGKVAEDAAGTGEDAAPVGTGKSAKKDGEGMGMGEGGVLDLELIKSEPDKLYPLIYYALKRTLRDWEQTMEERPESIKRSTQGMRAAATQAQSAEYLKPLFKSLRSRSLPADVLGRLSEIIHHMQERQYQRANDAYLRLSIGTAAWPIGVTMVGIHERSAREKISSDSVAHVLNDEVSRKYIQSVKRIMTFAQTKYPPDDVSQLMG